MYIPLSPAIEFWLKTVGEFTAFAFPVCFFNSCFCPEYLNGVKYLLNIDVKKPPFLEAVLSIYIYYSHNPAAKHVPDTV